MFGVAGVALPFVGLALEYAGASVGAALEYLGEELGDFDGVDEGYAAGGVVLAVVGGMGAVDAPGFLEGGDAIAEASVD